MALSKVFGCIYKYTVAGNFNHKPILPMFISVKYNSHDLVVILTEVIHPLDNKPVLRTVINLGAANDDLY